MILHLLKNKKSRIFQLIKFQNSMKIKRIKAIIII